MGPRIIFLMPFCAAAAATLAHLPNTSINAAKVDAAGNIYIAGYQGAVGAASAFVSKLSSDGSKVFYTKTFSGGKYDSVVALEIDSTGAAYVFGQTNSTVFPTTPGALQEKPASEAQAFAAKLDPQGNIVYTTLIGGTSHVFPKAGGLLVTAAGEAILSGQTVDGNFPAIAGAPFTSNETNAFFVIKLDAAGSKILSGVRGVGGRLAFDSQSNIYIAGTAYGASGIPLTPGAHQKTVQVHPCGGTGQLAFACSYQYITKLNPDMSQIVFSTLLDGGYGSNPALVSVDAQGSVLVAGSTLSPDYPTTANAFQPIYVANAPLPPQTCLFGCVFPPPASGYVTRLNSSGTALLYSTFLSGTQFDTITFASVASGGIYLSGRAGSSDFPGFDGVPMQCLPSSYETRMSPDGSSVSAARIVPGDVVAYDPATATYLAWTGTDLARFDPAAPPPAITCILDGADLKPVTQIAPGELLSIFGPRFANSTFSLGPGFFPRSIGGLSVTIGGTAAPLMYISPHQLNVQAPFEIAGAQSAEIAVKSVDVGVNESRALPVVAASPIALLDTVTPPESVSFGACTVSGLVYSGGPLPVAFNSDGARNSCRNPAKAGSIVSLILTGLGAISQQATGAITPDPGPPLNLPITAKSSGLSGTVTVVSAEGVPGLISGVWKVDLQLAPNLTGAIPLSLTVDGAPVRDTNLTVWVH
jgi:uncharacterized protein (TIGR03437 family)